MDDRAEIPEATEILSAEDITKPGFRISMQELIYNHHLEIDPKALKFAEAGYERMRRTDDPLHTSDHLDRMFAYLNNYLKTLDAKEISKINFNTLLMAISWHDVWRGEQYERERSGHTGIDSFKWSLNKAVENWKEGGEAAELTKAEMEKLDFSKEEVDDVYYSIKKHSNFQMLPRMGRYKKNAQIIADLDWVDLWSRERCDEYINYLKDFPSLDPKDGKANSVMKYFQKSYDRHRFHIRHFSELANELRPSSNQRFDAAIENYRQQWTPPPKKI